MNYLFFTFFFLLGFGAYSQIDTKKIESLCFDYHNVERKLVSATPREYSSTCQKAADLQTQYLVKNFKDGNSLHDQLVYTNGKIYKTEQDRYDLFNKDSVKFSDSNKKTSLFDYHGEIALKISGVTLKVDSTNNDYLAKEIIKWFKHSRGHYYNLKYEPYDVNVERGSFSVKLKIYEQKDGYVKFDLYCVAVFETSMGKSLGYDYKLKKWVN